MYHYKGGPDGSLTSMGFLKDTSGSIIDIGDCSTPIIVDWNSDGLLDLILGTYGPKDESNEPSYEWRIYLNHGTKSEYQFSSFSTLSTEDGNPILATSLVVRDADGDGKKDIIFSYEREVIFGWYKNRGSDKAPQFESYEHIELPEGAPHTLTFFELQDVTGDSVLDLLYVDFYYPEMSKGIKTTGIKSQEYIKSNSQFDVSQRGRELVISLQSVCEGGGTVALYDTRGRSVRTYSNLQKSLRIKDLSSGVYIVKVTIDKITTARSVHVQ